VLNTTESGEVILALLPHSSKHEKEDDKSSSIDHTMFDMDDEMSSSIDLKIFDIDDSNASDPDDCYHYIEKVSTSIQMFSIFITSLMIIN
jgi:hypothetical protein